MSYKNHLVIQVAIEHERQTGKLPDDKTTRRIRRRNVNELVELLRHQRERTKILDRLDELSRERLKLEDRLGELEKV